MSSETLHLQASQSDDQVVVRALYTQLMDGWNKSSGEAFAAPFAEDGHLIAFDGTHFKGRDEIVSFHQPLFVVEGEVEGDAARWRGGERAFPQSRRGPDARSGRDGDAREITTCAGVRLDSDARRYQAQRPMAPRRISEYKGQAHEPERSEYFHLAVHGLAVESVWSKEIDGQPI
jgi:hypothetical protein